MRSRSNIHARLESAVIVLAAAELLLEVIIHVLQLAIGIFQLILQEGSYQVRI